MKITAVLLMAACLQLSAKGITQTVNLNVKEMPLTKVLKNIEKQTGYVFFYDGKLVAAAQPVSVTVSQATIEATMTQVLDHTGLAYSVQGKTINIFKAPARNITSGASAASTAEPLPPPTVRGRIINEEGKPVAGVNISIKGGKVIGVTNDNGEFILNNIADNAVLVFTAVTIETFETRLNGRTELSLSSKTKVSVLDEVQMIAYGQTSKRLQTGNVSTVKAADIEKQPVNNPLLALSGRVPGLYIQQNSGVPGGGITVRLQGQNSLSRGSDPLYVIDGMPYSSQSLPNISGPLGILGNNGNTNSTFAPGGGGNPLSFINPADIESIDVLKDADATAIFGSRASNGAILITTKKGKSESTKVSLNIQTGWGKVAHFLPLLDTKQYIGMRKEAYKNDGLMIPSILLSPNDNNYDINGTWDTAKYTNWQKELLGGTAQYRDYRLSFSGGDVRTQFLLSAGHHVETTVFPGNLSDNKTSLHFSLTHSSLNKKFHFENSISYVYDDNQLINTDITNSAIRLTPNAPSLLNSDGSLNWAPLANGTSTWYNPLAYLTRKYKLATTNLMSSMRLAYHILKFLEISSNIGYSMLQTNELSINPLTGVEPESRPTTNRTSTFGYNWSKSLTIEPQISSRNTFGNTKLDILIGSTFLQTNNERQLFSGLGFNSDLVMEDIKSASSITATQTIVSAYKYNAIFGRATANFNNKYVLNIAIRKDGSSRFGSKNLFHSFSSVGCAWLFTNENLFKPLSKYLSFGKLKISYGTTGNDQIGDYQGLNLYSVVSVPVSYQGATSIAPSGLPNPNLQWELTKKLQVGIDLNFFNDKLILGATYYTNKSSNLLQSYTLPIFVGFGSLPINFPATVRNSGLELSLTSKIISKKSFQWTASVNVTLPRTKIIEFQNLASSSFGSLYAIGESPTVARAFHLLGVDPLTGQFLFSNIGGNPVHNPNSSTDRLLVNADPKLFGGLLNSLKFRNLELNVNFQFSKRIANNYYFGRQPGSFNSTPSSSTPTGNQPIWVLDRWQKPGDQTFVQKFSTQYSIADWSNSLGSDLGYTDASYIRLKMLSLSYNFTDLINRLHLQNAKIYLSSQNLFTISPYKGMDPENISTTSLPPLRTMILGIQIGF